MIIKDKLLAICDSKHRERFEKSVDCNIDDTNDASIASFVYKTRLQSQFCMKITGDGPFDFTMTYEKYMVTYWETILPRFFMKNYPKKKVDRIYDLYEAIASTTNFVIE